MNGLCDRSGLTREPAAMGMLSQRRRDTCISPVRVAVLVSLLLALNLPFANGNPSQKDTKDSERKTIASHEDLVRGKDISKTRIEKLEISRHEPGIEVRIEADGPLSYNAFALNNPDRVVLDFSGAVARVEPRLISSDLPPVRGARVGQFSPNVVRVVIDLEAQALYTIREDANSVTAVIEAAAEAGSGGGTDVQVPLVPKTLVASPPAADPGDAKKASLKQQAQDQIVREGSGIEAIAKPSSPIWDEVRPGEGVSEKPTVLAPASVEAPVLGKARPESNVPQIFPPSVLRTPLEKTITEPSIALVRATVQPVAGPISTSVNSNNDDLERETHSSVLGPGISAEREESPNVPWTPSDPDYVIGIDDVLAINVWKEPEISRAVFVRPDGKISLPLLGEVKADGLTPHALQTSIATALRSYLYEPEVTVAVQDMRSQRFNMVGEVNRPGTYQLSKPMTVLDAIAQAGGLRDFAKATKIYVLRVKPDGSRDRLPFNYKQALKGSREQGSLEVKARDTIVVP